jgi:hypothetical protein
MITDHALGVLAARVARGDRAYHATITFALHTEAT